MLKSGRQSDKDAYCTTYNQYSALLKKSRRMHFTDLIDQCSGDSKKLFKVVNSLCKGSQENPLPPLADPRQLANEFSQLFCKKIKLIKNCIENKFVVSPLSIECCSPDVKLEKFNHISESDVRSITTGSSNASCQLDPIATWLLKLCSDDLAPVITKIINLPVSLEEGYVPDHWKTALVVPLLKKPDLDVTFQNFLLCPKLQRGLLSISYSNSASCSCSVILRFPLTSPPTADFIRRRLLFCKCTVIS